MQFRFVLYSAIAIQSVRNLSKVKKNSSFMKAVYRIYLGYIFQFRSIQCYIWNRNFWLFLSRILIIVISFVATILLSFLLNKIDHHIKFVPIILLIILIYEISKFSISFDFYFSIWIINWEFG
jgi:hypothetical protein